MNSKNDFFFAKKLFRSFIPQPKARSSKPPLKKIYRSVTSYGIIECFTHGTLELVKFN